MIALLLALALQATPSPAAPSEDVVVIGERLKTWRGRIGDTSRTPLRCRTTKSTGDRDIDRIGCDTMVACFSRMRERMAAIGDCRRAKAERESLRASVERDLGVCFDERHDTLIAELAERRFQARQGE